MSLINQMLQELDARGTHAAPAGMMQGQVRVVPESDSRRMTLVLLAAVLLIALVAGLWWRQDKTAAPTPQTVPTPAVAQITPPAEQDRSSMPASPLASSAAEFSLKLSPDLRMAPLPDAKEMLAEEANKSQAVVARADAPAVEAKEKSAETKVAANSAPKQEVPVAYAKVPDAVVPLLNKQIKEASPQQNADNAYRHAVSLIQQGKSQEALPLLEQALQLDAHHASARQTLAALLIESKRKDEAIKRLREGVQLDPAQSGLAMLLARLQVDRGETGAAIETLQKTAPYASERADYAAFLAALLQREARHKEAIEQYRSALARQPQNGIWWMGLGISLQADGRSKEAAESYERARASGSLSSELRPFVEEKLRALQR
ncbi:MAG: tetratricopeptide repeat protein [Proteobacteria bacterium]|nr:tetratricopeptide repeat protein [Pseudomonadota bacterium]